MNEITEDEPVISNDSESVTRERVRVRTSGQFQPSRIFEISNSVPTPTAETFRKTQQRRVTRRGGALPLPTPIPLPLPTLIGPRVLEWKQDPFVGELGIRKAFLPGPVQSGPRDVRIAMSGPVVVSANAFGDYIEPLGTDQFDWVHTFAVVRQTLTMYQRMLHSPVPWNWNSSTNTAPITVYPHAGLTPNAYYSRADKALKFFYFDKPGAPAPAPRIFTCRALDIVAHETGHAVLDGLKPGWITSTTPQTGALHESFGDLTAMFVTLSQMDQVEALIAQSKANLHDKNFLAELAEEFGNALGRANGLRNADNDLTLSQVTNEVHDLSQVFTGGIYDILADLFVFERNFITTDPAATLYQVAQYLCGLVLRAIAAAPAANATFADVVNQMLLIAQADGKPVQYRNAIRNRFTVREVVVAASPMNRDMAGSETVQAFAHSSLEPGVIGNRTGCCGTMTHHEFTGIEDAFRAEMEELKKATPRR